MTFGPSKRQTVVPWGSRQPGCCSVGLADLHLDPLRQQDLDCLYSRSLVPMVVLMCAACSVFAYQHADCFPKTLLIWLGNVPCPLAWQWSAVLVSSRAAPGLPLLRLITMHYLQGWVLSVGYLQVCSDKSTVMR